MAKTVTSGEAKKRQKCKLFAQQNGRCYWCEGYMFLTFKELSPQPDALATLDHLDHRLSGDRGKYTATNELRHVLACRKCNYDRGIADQKRYLQEVQAAIDRVVTQPDSDESSST